MDTVIFIIEIDRYFEVYSENAEIAASKNPYSKLIRNTESSEYKEFLYEIISYCESLGLVYADNKIHKTKSTVSHYYIFYNFDDENAAHVNLIVQVKLTDHFHISKWNELSYARQVEREWNHNADNHPPILRTMHIRFNDENCTSYEDALCVLQEKLYELDDRYHFIKDDSNFE